MKTENPNTVVVTDPEAIEIISKWANRCDLSLGGAAASLLLRQHYILRPPIGSMRDLSAYNTPTAIRIAAGLQPEFKRRGRPRGRPGRLASETTTASKSERASRKPTFNSVMSASERKRRAAHQDFHREFEALAERSEKPIGST